MRSIKTALVAVSHLTDDTNYIAASRYISLLLDYNPLTMGNAVSNLCGFSPQTSARRQEQTGMELRTLFNTDNINYRKSIKLSAWNGTALPSPPKEIVCKGPIAEPVWPSTKMGVFIKRILPNKNNSQITFKPERCQHGRC